MRAGRLVADVAHPLRARRDWWRLRRAARHDGFFVIGLDRPDELDEVTAGLADHDPGPGFEVVVDLQPEQDPTPWLDRGASWVLTRIGPFDLDLAEVRRTIQAGP